MSRPQNSNAMRYGPSYPSMGPVVVRPVCPACGGTPLGTRSVYCKPACKQLAYRLRRRTSHSTVDPAVLRKDLQRRRLLVAHTVYECPRCGERFLGERRCGDCNLYARSIGLGGNCPDCDAVILLADLLGPKVITTS
jgi:ribosomal protein L32